ncbi:class I SAM-dependent methyltransferase [Nocardiopsis sp. RSe5-2]|uniref:Class I SAM-dependent methyltransferase n=1 Tax=Nocardiopsis endophytica TaxID=3018445 RepID=A0ABT4U913_9ACTN|nr:class I SAM-dependent methyltransferase [Nocardiopsis endophytica]MDA2813422.1 class I SAM-dependent methyltransferase [Nocardiopsis endophytica]
MIPFSDFDTRRYPTVDVATGYGAWAKTYEGTVEDLMDIDLLERLNGPEWASVRRAADLGCGTGRTGAWLREKGARSVDGVDLTPEMLAIAEEKGAHESLRVGDATDSGLEGGAYDLVISSLIDEHLEDVGPLYAEAARLARPGGWLVMVTFHPQFMITTGMPTHYTDARGRSFTIATHLHLVSDHVKAAVAAGWQLREMHEGVVDDRWVELKPKWAKFRSTPVSAVYAWQK